MTSPRTTTCQISPLFRRRPPPPTSTPGLTTRRTPSSAASVASAGVRLVARRGAFPRAGCAETLATFPPAAWWTPSPACGWFAPPCTTSARTWRRATAARIRSTFPAPAPPTTPAPGGPAWPLPALSCPASAATCPCAAASGAQRKSTRRWPTADAAARSDSSNSNSSRTNRSTSPRCPPPCLALPARATWSWMSPRASPPPPPPPPPR